MKKTIFVLLVLVLRCDLFAQEFTPQPIKVKGETNLINLIEEPIQNIDYQTGYCRGNISQSGIERPQQNQDYQTGDLARYILNSPEGTRVWELFRPTQQTENIGIEAMQAGYGDSRFDKHATQESDLDKLDEIRAEQQKKRYEFGASYNFTGINTVFYILTQREK